jgi:hypothetical protein
MTNMNLFNTFLLSPILEKFLRFIFIFEFKNFKMFKMVNKKNFKNNFLYITKEGKSTEKSALLIRFVISNILKPKMYRGKEVNWFQIYQYYFLKCFEILKIYFYYSPKILLFFSRFFWKRENFLKQHFYYLFRLNLSIRFDIHKISKEILNKKSPELYSKKKNFFIDLKYFFYFSKKKNFFLNFMKSKKWNYVFGKLDNRLIEFTFWKELDYYLFNLKKDKIYVYCGSQIKVLNFGVYILKIYKFFNLFFFKFLNKIQLNKLEFNFLIDLDIIFCSIGKFFHKIFNKRNRFSKIKSFKFIQKNYRGEGTFFAFLESINSFFWSFKNYQNKTRLFLIWFKVENIILKFGEKILLRHIKDLKLKSLISDIPLNNLILINLSKNCKIKFYQSSKVKIRDLDYNLFLTKNKIFFSDFFVHYGISKINKINIGSFIEPKMKIFFKNIRFILNLVVISGWVGKTPINPVYSFKFLREWNMLDRKFFWKYWIFNEVFNTNTISRTIMFKIRLSYFFLYKYNYSKDNFL